MGFFIWEEGRGEWFLFFWVGIFVVFLVLGVFSSLVFLVSFGFFRFLCFFLFLNDFRIFVDFK